nr:MFS transporter [Paenibacillus daejeonensis]
MIVLDIIRAIMIGLLPFFTSVWIIFAMVFLIHMASHVFGIGAFIYVTKLIPEAMRPRFNSLHTLLGSGSFLIGPAIAGLLFMIGTPVTAIYINAMALLISGFITFLLPNIEEGEPSPQHQSSHFSFAVWKSDVHQVIHYYKQHLLVMAICLLFGGLTVVMASSVDSLEAAFSTLVLGLTESEYGVLVSIAGAGILTGSMINTFIVTRVRLATLINVGALGNCLGYLIYAFSDSFLVAAIGFFVLAFFLAFANTGFATWYQKTIPIHLMGRIGGFNGLIESLLTLVVTLLFGVLAEMVPLRSVIVGGVLMMLGLGVALTAFNREAQPNHRTVQFKQR